MAHYVWNTNTPEGALLRTMLSSLDDVLHTAQVFTDLFNQMSNAQIFSLFGFSDGVNAADATTAGNAKAELLSDLGKLLTDGSQTSVFSALKQCLAEFG